MVVHIIIMCRSIKQMSGETASVNVGDHKDLDRHEYNGQLIKVIIKECEN